MTTLEITLAIAAALATSIAVPLGALLWGAARTHSIQAQKIAQLTTLLQTLGVDVEWE